MALEVESYDEKLGTCRLREEHGRTFSAKCEPTNRYEKQTPEVSMQPQDAQTWLSIVRKSKGDVHYGKANDGGGERCGGCRFFVPEMNACSLVEGWIEPDYVSDFYEPRSEASRVNMSKNEKRSRDGKKTITTLAIRAGDEVASRVSKYQAEHTAMAYGDAMKIVLEEDEGLAKVYKTGPGQLFYGDETD